MPVLYIHGVATRDDWDWKSIEKKLKTFVAPIISDDPGGVMIEPVYWGDVGVRFNRGGISRPKSRIVGAGPEQDVGEMSTGERAVLATELAPLLPESRPQANTLPEGVVASGFGEIGVERAPLLKELPQDRQADVIAAAVEATSEDPTTRAELLAAAEAVLRDPNFLADLAGAATCEDETRILADHLDRAATGVDVIPQGAGGLARAVASRVDEGLRRTLSLPGYVASALVAEFRRPINTRFATFLGDVFVYLNNRGKEGSPGEIPRRFLDKLTEAHQAQKRRGDEPLVVISHSMGGQIVYDAVTHFLPKANPPTDVRIDFWCATASQVGLFKEMELFLEDTSKNPHKQLLTEAASFPGGHLGYWLNVWDPNDFISFTTCEIIDAVLDESYESGMSLIGAHSGYTHRDSFCRRLAKHLREAKAGNWRRP
jgi:hypothetical protein